MRGTKGTVRMRKLVDPGLPAWQVQRSPHRAGLRCSALPICKSPALCHLMLLQSMHLKRTQGSPCRSQQSPPGLYLCRRQTSQQLRRREPPTPSPDILLLPYQADQSLRWSKLPMRSRKVWRRAHRRHCQLRRRATAVRQLHLAPIHCPGSKRDLWATDDRAQRCKRYRLQSRQAGAARCCDRTGQQAQHTGMCTTPYLSPAQLGRQLPPRLVHLLRIQ